MKTPLQVTFRNMEPSAIVAEWIRAESEKLETFYNPIMACNVIVEIPHRHRTRGNPYRVRIDLRVPRGELVIKRKADPRKQAREAGKGEVTKDLEIAMPHKDLRLAIDDAFGVAGRRLQDYARRQSGRVKMHQPPLRAQVSKLQANEGYGFLTADDGREIYFHKQSVLNRGFARLRVGTAVTFVEEQGDKGPQASTVRIIGGASSRPVGKAAAGA